MSMKCNKCNKMFPIQVFKTHTAKCGVEVKKNTQTEKKYFELEILKKGTGQKAAKKGDTVSVHYVGSLTDGKEFDNSRKNGKPFSFVLGAGSVIKAWDVGLQGLTSGTKAKLTCEPEYGYGAQGSGKSIPPNAVLVFEVEIIGVN